MKIWKLDADMHGYQSYKLANEDKAFLRDFKKEMSNGKRKDGQLDNLEIEIVDEGKASDMPQFWNFTGTLLVSEKAKKCLEKDLEDCVEFIAVKFINEKFYLINVIKILDAIDYDRAIFRKLDTGLVVTRRPLKQMKEKKKQEYHIFNVENVYPYR